MKTKRELGKHLEERVSAYLREALKDDSIRPTKASGASTQLGDVICRQYLIECKARSTESITIKEDVWNKLVSEIPINSTRMPLYVLENKNGKMWAVLDFQDFCGIIKEK
jgi:Holliday junction resolvase